MSALTGAGKAAETTDTVVNKAKAKTIKIPILNFPIDIIPMIIDYYCIIYYKLMQGIGVKQQKKQQKPEIG
jgi:hypothetical protein